MANELKPCPFCGGEAKTAFSIHTGIYMIVCECCGAIISFKGNESKSKARVAYNRRATDGE